MEVCSGIVECAVAAKVAAKRMWQAAFADAHSCLPKALPLAVSHVSYGGAQQLGFTQAGSFRTIHFRNNHHMKEKVEEVNHEALKLKLEIVEGGIVGDLVKYAKETIHIADGAIPNTCVVHWSCEYEALSEEHKSQVPLALQEGIPPGYKQLEKYLLSHDDYKEEGVLYGQSSYVQVPKAHNKL